MAAPRVVLVDGTGLIFRAFFALPATLATTAGLPTNAAFGFAQMFRKILQGRQPSYGAVVFDAGGRTFRNELDPDYKAQRPRMPDALRKQLPSIDRLVEAHHFPIVRVPGVEADDVIATLWKQARDRGMEVTLVSGDKDFAQLVLDDAVRLFDSTAEVFYDPDRVRRKWGVRPEQFADYLALVGVKQVLKTIHDVEKHLNHKVEVAAVLPTFFDGRTRLGREVLSTLREHFSGKCLSPIRLNTRLAEAPSHKKTIFEYAPNSKGAEDYGAVVSWMIGDNQLAHHQQPTNPKAA